MEEFEKRRGFDDVNVGLGVCVGRRRVGIGFQGVVEEVLWKVSLVELRG